MKLHPITQEILEFQGTPEDLVKYIRTSDHIRYASYTYKGFYFPFWDYEISEQDLQKIFDLIDKYRSKRKNCDELKSKWEKIYREGWEYEDFYDLNHHSAHIIHSELAWDLVDGIREKEKKRSIYRDVRKEFPNKKRLVDKLSNLRWHAALHDLYESSVQDLKQFSSIPQYLDFEDNED